MRHSISSESTWSIQQVSAMYQSAFPIQHAMSRLLLQTRAREAESTNSVSYPVLKMLSPNHKLKNNLELKVYARLYVHQYYRNKTCWWCLPCSHHTNYQSAIFLLQQHRNTRCPRDSMTDPWTNTFCNPSCGLLYRRGLKSWWLYCNIISREQDWRQIISREMKHIVVCRILICCKSPLLSTGLVCCTMIGDDHKLVRFICETRNTQKQWLRLSNEGIIPARQILTLSQRICCTLVMNTSRSCYCVRIPY